MDKYQARYIAHQKRKKEILSSNYGITNYPKYSKKEKETFEKILKNRCSQRAFNSNPVDITEILELAEYRPSSCNRKGVEIKVIETRDEKDLLSGLLVGGVGWSNRADKILLLIANEEAYKSPAEKEFMCYIDAGVLAQTIYLICESRNLGCCYINPNIRENNKAFFKERFGEGKFCGALAIGNYDLKHYENTNN